MPLMNLATVFGPSLLRPPAAVQGQSSPPVDISQEVVVQVGHSISTGPLWRNNNDYLYNTIW